MSGTWKLAAIAALASALALNASHAQQPQSVKLIYDVHFGGIRVGEAEIKGAIGDETYRVSTNLRTQGMVDAFFSALVKARSEGALDESGALIPAKFRADAKTSRKDQLVEIVYRDGAPSIAKAKPAFKKKSYQIVPEKQVGTLDPLSAALKALTPAPAAEICDSRMEVFDGRKRYAIEFSNPRKKGDMIHCDGTYERVAGFKPKYMKRQKRFPFEVSYLVNQKGMAVVDRVSVETDYGFGVAKRR